MFNIITDKTEISDFFSMYFSLCGGRNFKDVLEGFLVREGGGHNVIFVFFKEDFDDEPEDLPIPLDDQHVLIEFTLMGSNERNIAYVDFPTFYDYVYKHALYEIAEGASADEIMPLVHELRKSLLGD